MVAFIILASSLITKNALFGWLINEQNRMSLSRLQMFLWTVVILSAYVAAVLANVQFKYYDKGVSIAIPQEVWLAMGISTTSLVGTGLILETKKRKKAVEPHNVKVTKGILVVNEKPSLLDLVHGEEVSNHDKIDLTRMQNLLFTFVLVGSYAASLNAMFANLVTATPGVTDITVNFPITKFPELGAGAIALLLVSHGGYLVAKAIDKQPSQVQTQP
jgi:hypothetical protein